MSQESAFDTGNARFTWQEKNLGVTGRLADQLAAALSLFLVEDLSARIYLSRLAIILVITNS